MSTAPVSNTSQVDFLEYHRSLAAELEAIKNRVSNLTAHRPTIGSFKEAALRSVLRRHLPDNLRIGTGFIVNSRNECSTQIDLLIVDVNQPTLFKDGDLMIVTPSAVRGIIEVKSTLSGEAQLTEACTKVADCQLICHGAPSVQPIFKGLYVYDASPNQELNIAKAMRSVYVAGKGFVNGVAYGSNVIASPHAIDLAGGKKSGGECVVWSSPKLGPAYFLSLILSTLSQSASGNDVWAFSQSQPDNRIMAYIDPDSGLATPFVEGQS